MVSRVRPVWLMLVVYGGWLIVAVYAAWLAALILLAWTSPREVVSRGQLASANVVVRGRVVPDSDGGWQVHVLEILQEPVAGTPPIEPGQRVSILQIDQASGWEGIGEYVLPLKTHPSGWELASVPNSFGLTSVWEARRQIYPASMSVLRQVRERQGD